MLPDVQGTDGSGLAIDRGPTGDYQLLFAKRLQYVSVPDGSDVEVRTHCFRFFLERAERRIMP